MLSLSCEKYSPEEGETILIIEKNKKTYLIEKIEFYDPSPKSEDIEPKKEEEGLFNSDNRDVLEDSIAQQDFQESISSNEDSQPKEETSDGTTIPEDASKSLDLADNNEVSSDDQQNLEEQISDPNASCGTTPYFIDVVDTAFREAIKALIPDAFEGDKIDVNHCSVKELESMDVRDKGLSRVDEIEYFTGLTVLKCDKNQLTSLNVSANVNLTEVRCSENQLNSINLSENINLETLYVYSNKLTSLDLSRNINLGRISLRNNKLEQLDMRTIVISRSRNFTLNAYDGSKNRLTQLHIHEDMKQHTEVIEAKTHGESAISIATYLEGDNRSCLDWDPLESICKDDGDSQ